MSLGLNGIANAGNTCYMNTILQCLSNTPAFRQVVLSGEYVIHPESKTKGEVNAALAQFMKAMWTSENVVLNATPIPRALRGSTQKFLNNTQEDAEEFLLYLLEALSEETKRLPKHRNNFSRLSQVHESSRALYSWEKFQSLESSPFSDIFVGQLRSSIACSLCKRTSKVYEIFWELSLPVPSSEGSVYDCLEKFFSGEMLRNTCQFCQRQTDLRKVYKIERLPTVLVLWFKRFSSNHTQKISSRVRFPRNDLNLNDYMSSTGREQQPGITYNLCAVANHRGSSALYGHYNAICRRERRCYLYDDEEVKAVDATILDSVEVGCAAYILMYQKG